MQTTVIEGAWDELITRADLRGHRVRVTVLDESPGVTDHEDQLKRIHAYSTTLPNITQFVDDSRESIYSGTSDDPR